MHGCWSIRFYRKLRTHKQSVGFPSITVPMVLTALTNYRPGFASTRPCYHDQMEGSPEGTVSGLVSLRELLSAVF